MARPRSRLYKPQHTGFPIFRLASVFLLLAATLLFIYELLHFTQQETFLPSGVRVAGISVGGMTEAQATSAIEEVYSSPITLYYDEAPINLNPDTIGFDVNTPVLIAAARSAGDTGSGFWGRFVAYMFGRDDATTSDIALQADYQRNALRVQLESIAQVFDRAGGNVRYDLDTLTIQTSATGYTLNVEAAIERIDEALRRPNARAVPLPIESSAAPEAGLAVLRELIIAYLDSQGFLYDATNSVASVFVLDLQTGAELHILSDVAYSAASTSKVGILLDFYRGLNRDPNQDEAFLLANSLLCSANSSSNLIMETYLGNGNIFSGLASVNQTLQDFGAFNSFITAPFIDGSVGQQLGAIRGPDTAPNPGYNTFPDTFNQTTAADMGTLFSLIYDCAVHGSGLAAIESDNFTMRECRQMIELMTANDLERLLQAGIPPDVEIAHKNGWVPGQLAGAEGAMIGDAGIIFSPSGRHYILAVYLWERTDGTGFDRWELVEGISRAAWNYFNPNEALPQRRPNLPPSANECFTQAADGTRTYNYLPPYGSVDLNNINGWRDGSPTTPQPSPGA